MHIRLICECLKMWIAYRARLVQNELVDPILVISWHIQYSVTIWVNFPRYYRITATVFVIIYSSGFQRLRTVVYTTSTWDTRGMHARVPLCRAADMQSTRPVHRHIDTTYAIMSCTSNRIMYTVIVKFVFAFVFAKVIVANPALHYIYRLYVQQTKPNVT